MPLDDDCGADGATPPVVLDASSALVRRAQRGDTAAFEHLYHEHVSRIHGLCLWMTRDRSVAEDLTQEVFVRAWRKLHLFRPGGAFSAWLHRLAVNVVLSDRRSSARMRARFVLTDDVPETDDAPRGDRPDLAMDLERGITELPDGARTVLVLHDLYGYKHNEIAELTGMAVGTSKAQLHRARARLREVLR